MPHPVHTLLQRFLETQQYSFDPRERALFPTERPAPTPRATEGRAPEPASKRIAYGSLGYRN